MNLARPTDPHRRAESDASRGRVREALCASRSSTVWALVAVAVGGLTFQVVHLLEHVAQAGYWIVHPTEPPWLTPWAVTGRDALAVSGSSEAGAEVLHLVGNVVFFVALLALAALAACKGVRATEFSGLRPALVVQGLHVAEHVALTVSQIWIGRAVGISTLLGIADAGPAAWSYRVLFHFAINLAATGFALYAATAMYRRRALFPDVALLRA